MTYSANGMEEQLKRRVEALEQQVAALLQARVVTDWRILGGRPEVTTAPLSVVAARSGPPREAA